MASMLSNFGFGIANTYFVASSKYSAKDLGVNSLFLAAFLGGILVIISYFVFPLLQTSFLKSISINQMILAMIIVPFLLLFSYFSSIVLGQNRIILLSIVNTVQWLAFLVLLIGFYLTNGLNVFTAVLSWGLAIVLSGLLALGAVFYRQPSPFTLNLKALKESLGFGIKGYAANLMTFFNYRLDLFLVNAFLNVTQVGFYSLAVSMAELLWYVPDSIGVVLFPRIPRATKEEARALTASLCRHTLFLTAGLGLIGVFLARTFVALILPQFLPALQPFYLLVPGIVALSIAKIIASDLVGRGKPIYATIAAAVTVVFTVILDILLIPAMGIVGAALASTLVYFLSSFLALKFFFRESMAGWRESLLIRRSDLALYADWLKRLGASILKPKPEEGR